MARLPELFLRGLAMRYGWSKDGSFVFADDERRVGHFAYRSSPYEEMARRDPERVVGLMLASAWGSAPTRIREEHYSLSCKELETATRWPK